MSTTDPFGRAPRAQLPTAEPGAQGDVYTGVISRLLAGPVGIGGLGWTLDRWLNTSFLLPSGILLGMALALYVIWLRYGTS